MNPGSVVLGIIGIMFLFSGSWFIGLFLLFLAGAAMEE